MDEAGWSWRPLGVADLFGDMFKIYRRQFGLLFVLNAAVLAPVALLQAALAPAEAGEALSWLADIEGTGLLAPPDPAVVVAMTGHSLLSALLTLAAAAYLTAAGVWLASQHLHGRRPALADVLGAGLRHFGRVLGSSVLLGLVLLTATFVLVLLITVLAAALGPPAAGVAGVLATGLAVAAVALGVRWLLAAPAIVAEELGVTPGISRSFQLASGAGWNILGRYVLLVLMVALLSLTPAMVVGKLADAALAGASGRLAELAAGVGGALVSALFQPLLPVLLTLLYYDRRVRTEGYDLQQLADGPGPPPLEVTAAFLRRRASLAPGARADLARDLADRLHAAGLGPGVFGLPAYADDETLLQAWLEQQRSAHG